MGIMTNDELWFSRFDCLNDIQEGTYIQGSYQNAIDELRGEVDDKFLDVMAKLKPDFRDYFRISPIEKDGSYLVTPKDSIPYLCCFSTSKADSYGLFAELIHMA